VANRLQHCVTLGHHGVGSWNSQLLRRRGIL